MRNLMQIEADFLSLPSVRSQVNFATIENLINEVSDAKKSKFDKSLKLAKLVQESLTWFNKSETKTQLEDEGIEWSNTEVFFNRVFGWQKSFGYKMAKAGKLQIEQPSVVTKFKRQCTTAENNGEDVQRSIEALLKFAKNEENGTEESDVARAKTYATFSISKDGVNGEKGYSVRLTDEGISVNGDLEIDIANHLMAVFNHMKSILGSDDVDENVLAEMQSVMDSEWVNE